MILHFEGQTYDYDVNKLSVQTAIAIKAHTGLGLKSWVDAITDGDPLAIQALFFAIKQQNGERLVLADLDFDLMAFMQEFGRAAQAEADLQAAAEAALPKVDSTSDDLPIVTPTPT